MGLLIVPLGTDKDALVIKSYMTFVKKNKIPILFSRSSNPYNQLGIKLSNNLGEESASRVALDLAQKMGASVLAFDVKEPEFFSQSSTSDVNDLVKFEDSARYKSVKVKHEAIIGNAAKELSERSDSIGLYILNASRYSNWQSKKTTDYVALNSDVSVLVVPARD